MEIKNELTDEAILREIGGRIAHHRIARGLTQAALAREAGLSKRTLERIEAGAPAQTTSLIRILRLLDLLHGMDALLPPARPGPMELLRHKGKARQRAPRQRKTATPQKWSWQTRSTQNIAGKPREPRE